MTRANALLTGLVVALGSLLAAGGVYLLAEEQVADAVSDLARAPAGCTTTLSFAESGTFWFYTEVRGELDQAPNGCDVPTSWRFENQPDVTLELRDSGGTGVRLTADTSKSYDVDRAAGVSTHRVEIPSPGNYDLRVESSATGFVVAVGREPSTAGTVLRWLALGIAVGGVLVALGFVIRSRRPPAQAAPAGGPIPGLMATQAPQAMWSPPAWAPPPASAPTGDEGP